MSDHNNLFDHILETSRMILRRIKESDAQDMFEYTSHEDCSRFLSWHPHKEIVQTEKYIQTIINSYDKTNEYTWAIELKGQNKFIGVVRIFDVSLANKRCEISYIMNPAFQGQGLMSESINLVLNFLFQSININRVQARCTPDNKASEGVMKKLGLKYEGKLEQYWQIKGAFKDAILYAITANNYNKKTADY